MVGCIAMIGADRGWWVLWTYYYVIPVALYEAVRMTELVMRYGSTL